MSMTSNSYPTWSHTWKTTSASTRIASMHRENPTVEGSSIPSRAQTSETNSQRSRWLPQRCTLTLHLGPATRSARSWKPMAMQTTLSRPLEERLWEVLFLTLKIGFHGGESVTVALAKCQLVLSRRRDMRSSCSHARAGSAMWLRIISWMPRPRIAGRILRAITTIRRSTPRVVEIQGRWTSRLLCWIGSPSGIWRTRLDGLENE